MGVKLNNILLYSFLFLGVSAKIEVCIPNEIGNPADSLEGLLSDLKGEVNSFVSPYKAADTNSSYYLGDFNVSIDHPAVRLTGTLKDVTLYGIDKTKLCLLEGFDVMNLIKPFDLFEILASNLSFTGQYNVTGNVGQLFDIYGEGPFWIHLYGFSVQALNVIPYAKEENSMDKICFPINVDVHLNSTDCHFSGLMNDAELEELFNNVIKKLAPEAVTVVWSEVKQANDQHLQELIDQIIDKIFPGEQLGKMMNLIFKGGFSFPMCHTLEKLHQL